MAAPSSRSLGREDFPSGCQRHRRRELLPLVRELVLARDDVAVVVVHVRSV